MVRTINKKTGEENPDSNEVLNIIMIVLGVLFIIQGLSVFLVWFGVNPPVWVETIISSVSGTEGQAAMALIGQGGMVTLVLGVWCLISGIGMFQEQEWAWGQALVVLSIMFVNSFATVMTWFAGAFDASNWTTWITLIGFITSVIGFFWLMFTKKRYA